MKGHAMTQRDFDVIIIGAGSAGCVLANRLSADPSTRVLLVEAGGSDRTVTIQMPMGISQILPPGKSSANWDYWTTPQQHLDNRKLFWPRGKVLGGSSSINGMVYIRGAASDYDHWRQLGCTGWAWDDVLPYFRKAEDSARGSDAFHGTGGPLHSEQRITPNILAETFMQAGQEGGFPMTPDFNGAQFEGFGWYDTTTKDGTRWSAAKGYLYPVKDRKNLTILTGALVEKIIFSGKCATAVRLAVGREQLDYTAKAEIILCGGAVNSPQTLMLSGIGPAEHLRAHNIDVVADRPEVGSNLQDHLDSLLQWKIEEPISFNRFAHFPRNLMVGAQWLLTRDGPGSGAPTPAGAFIKTRPELETPDVQIHFIAGLGMAHGIESDLKNSHGYMLHLCQLRPESRGTIRLASANPADHPLIDPNYLSAPEDIETQVAGISLARTIGNAPAFQKFRPTELWPGPAATGKAEIAAALRKAGETIYHPVATCRMGPDDASVVDLELRVRGVQGLRVVDASVMPRLVSGNTNAPTIMIAEKAADMVLASLASGARAA
jgi:choline dehydrogenase